MRGLAPRNSYGEDTGDRRFFRRCVSPAVQVSMAMGTAPLTLLGLDTDGFTVETQGRFGPDITLYFTFSVSRCLSVTIPARFRQQRPAENSTHRKPRFLVDFDFVEDGSDRTEVLGMLVHTATTADLVH